MPGLAEGMGIGPAWEAIGKYAKVNPRESTLSPALGGRAPQSSSLCEFCNTPTDIQHQARAKVFSTFQYLYWSSNPSAITYRLGDAGKSLTLSELQTPHLK